MTVASYEVTAPAPRRAAAYVRRLAPTVALLVVAVGAVLVAAGPVPFTVGAVAVIFVFVAVVLTLTARAERVLVVEPPGVRIGPAAVPWASIRQVVVVPVAGTGEVEVGLRLRPAAPLPGGARAMLFDPARPRAFQLRHRFPARRVDPNRLLATARTVAPPTVATLTEAAPVPDPRAANPRATGRGQASGTVVAVRFRSGRRVFLRTPSVRGPDYRHRFTRHPVVRFDLPDGRHVVAETGAPGAGEPGDRVVVTYDNADPTEARVVGPTPRARWLRTA